VRYSLFCEISQRRLVVRYRRCGKNYWSHIQGSNNPRRWDKYLSHHVGIKWPVFAAKNLIRANIWFTLRGSRKHTRFNVGHIGCVWQVAICIKSGDNLRNFILFVRKNTVILVNLRVALSTVYLFWEKSYSVNQKLETLLSPFLNVTIYLGHQPVLYVKIIHVLFCCAWRYMGFELVLRK
jgi:hypothetical protein